MGSRALALLPRLALAATLLASACAAPDDPALGGPARDDRQDRVDFDGAWDYGDPAGTEERFLGLLPAVEAEGNPGRVLELRTQIARTKSLRRQIEEADAILDEVDAALAVGGRELETARIRALLERGRTRNSAGDPAASIPLFQEAWGRARALSAEFHAVDAAHMLGIVCPGDEALEWTQRAVDYAELCSDPRARGWRGSLLQNLWYAHLERGELETALGYAQRCRAFHKEAGNEDRERVGRWLVLHTTRKLGRLEEALAGFRELLADHGPAGDPSGYTEEELGECLHALGRPDEARPFFARAHARLSRDPWLVENEPERIARLKRLGTE